jgi:ATP-dependent DNA helicase 2 subunit 1
MNRSNSLPSLLVHLGCWLAHALYVAVLRFLVYQQVQGSTVAFAALLDRLLASDKVGICLWTRRNNTPPRFVALLPQVRISSFKRDPLALLTRQAQEEELDDDGLQVNPPGFHLIPLPFSDDIREVRAEPQPPGTL